MKKRQRLSRIFFAAILYLAAAKTGLAYNAELLKAGDRFYQEKSYQMALDQYRALLQGSASLPPEVIRELDFKSADCLWRGRTENTPVDEAERILKDLQSSKDHDRWWAEANESLADYYLKVNRWAHTEEIKQFLMLARDYWAGAGDVESARPRFIKASFTLGDYLSQNWGWYYTGITPTRFSETRPGLVPQPEASGLDILYIEILKVAKSDGDKARAHYGLAMSYLYRAADQKTQELVEDHFNEVIGNYKASEWVDDAYYSLGQFFEGRSEFKKALMYYQGLLGRFKAGESQWIDQARERVKQITEPAVSVNVGYTFLPGSEIQLALSWRNVIEARVTLYKMDMVREMQARAGRLPTDSDWGISDYSTLIREVVESGRYNFLHSERSWVQKFKEEGKHLYYSENKGLAEWLKDENEEKIDAEKGRLSPGAYLVLVTAGGKKAYDLILVTDMGLVVKTAGQSALFFAFDSKTGEPRRAARVKSHYRYYNDQNNWVWEEISGVTDDSGLLSVRLKTALNSQNYQSNQHNLFAAASDGTMQTFTQGSYYNYRAQATPWRLYAFSDRPAYRPNEEVAFKGILRQYDGAAFRTPAGATVHARIYDARGNKIKEGSYVLNPYGSFDDRLVLDEKAALGEYRLEIWSENWQNQLAAAPLFRLEEYKLPEFLVNIKTKPQEKDGKTVTTYRLGDTVEVELNAEYYFGGAVADADVEYRIYQSPYYPAYSPARPYPWYYADFQQQYSYTNYGETLLKQDKVKTDKEGHAVFKFETPGTSPTDLNYRIEARVVDQSRREIISGSEIKVTRYSFFACLTPKQNLYRPGDRAEIGIKTLTANQEPVSVEAKISVLKNGWQPGPMEPLGQTETRIPGDRMAVAGHYSGTEVLSKFVKTDAKGEAKFEFEPSEDGFYVIQFTGYDNTSGEKIESQASVYVCTKQSRDIGYRYGGLQIIPEKDTYTIGETARVMLVAERPDTWVLLTREAEEIYDHQMVHLEGPVRLLEFPVRDIDTPNVFLQALSGDRYELKMHALELIVPPEEKFLNIKITSDQETYQPQQEGHFEITVTDQDGKPVVGEVALGIVDKSVYYIQGEYVPDIRQYFYGQKRIHSVTTQASFHDRSFVRLERGDKDQGLSGGKAWEQERRQNAVGNSLGAVMDAAEVAAPASMVLKSEFALDRDVGARQAKRLGDFREDKKMDSLKQKTASEEAPDLAAADVRTDFRSTVIWQPAVVTDLGGKASLTVKFPDSLTTWQTTARVITPQTTVGNITHDIKTKKDVIVRLQAPRFFTERDQVTISANVHNYTDQEQKIKVSLKAGGLKNLGEEFVWVAVPQNGEKRVDWTCLVSQVPSGGQARLTVMAQTEKSSDAMERLYPVIPHGIEKFIASALVLKGEDAAQETSANFTIQVPAERIKESTSLEIVLSPSLAAAMLDALPYLADYPYGCVEQTMSRFLPSVIVAKAMREMGLSPEQVAAYISDVLEPRGDPQGHPPRRREATVSKLDRMVLDGLNRLYDFQHNDGGWGWWKEDDTNRFMTAYVVWGLALARDAGVDVRGDVMDRAVQYLQKELVEEENNPDTLAWMLHALSWANSSSAFETKHSDRLWQMRDQLNPYTRALFAVSEWNRGNKEHAQILARNLANGIKEDKANGTAHWGEAGINYRWSEGGVEATAFAVKALAMIDPQSVYLQPAVKWLCLNRRGASWKNTRDTAIAILGLTEYLKTTAELNPDYEYAILVNGKTVRQGKVDAGNVFTFNRILRLPDDVVQDGPNTVEVKLKGKGALYLSGYLEYFTLEEDITAAGNEIFVERKYFREATKETLLKGYTTEWIPLENGQELKSGERVRVEITLDAKNHYEYLVVEDHKPAGFEAVDLKSGTTFAEAVDETGRPSGAQSFAYREFRDKKVAFFMTKLPQGRHTLTYELRAEVPGEFHGMPDLVHAMYVPEIRANSAEARFKIGEREE